MSKKTMAVGRNTLRIDVDCYCAVDSWFMDIENIYLYIVEIEIKIIKES